jgi:hypothetical protein
MNCPDISGGIKGEEFQCESGEWEKRVESRLEVRFGLPPLEGDRGGGYSKQYIILAIFTHISFLFVPPYSCSKLVPTIRDSHFPGFFLSVWDCDSKHDLSLPLYRTCSDKNREKIKVRWLWRVSESVRCEDTFNAFESRDFVRFPPIHEGTVLPTENRIFQVFRQWSFLVSLNGERYDLKMTVLILFNSSDGWDHHVWMM